MAKGNDRVFFVRRKDYGDDWREVSTPTYVPESSPEKDLVKAAAEVFAEIRHYRGDGENLISVEVCHSIGGPVWTLEVERYAIPSFSAKLIGAPKSLSAGVYHE